MYLTKSRRPEISTAVSFGATNNSHTPLQYHYKELLYMVEFLRTTPDDGLIIRASHDEKIQFYCQVDARYLLERPHRLQYRTDEWRVFLYPKFQTGLRVYVIYTIHWWRIGYFSSLCVTSCGWNFIYQPSFSKTILQLSQSLRRRMHMRRSASIFFSWWSTTSKSRLTWVWSRSIESPGWRTMQTYSQVSVLGTKKMSLIPFRY